MTNQKHTVATDALETLGTIIDERAGRDAIHLAVEPVEAGVKLAVGAHVELRDGKAYATAPGEGVGIVDPFLGDAVKKGQRFWLVVYPRTITSLRHVWTHPAFVESAEATLPGVSEHSKATSELWLRQFIEQADCPNYETVINAAQGIFPPGNDDYYRSGGYINGEYMHFYGWDAHGEIPPEFWTHVEVVTGKKPTKRPAYFSCSC